MCKDTEIVIHNSGTKLQSLISYQGDTTNMIQIGKATLGFGAITNTIIWGKIGIGITDPGYKLDVSGDANISGVYCVNGVDVWAGKQNTITAGTGISISGTTINANVFTNMAFKYSITSTRSYIAPNMWYNYFDISSVISTTVFGHNLRMFQLTFISDTDFGDTSIVWGPFNIRTSDFSGLKWQNDSDYIFQNCTNLTVMNYNQKRVTRTTSTTLQAYMTSIV